MGNRLTEIPPSNPYEIERFYLEVIDKLKGTTVSIEEVDQRSNWPGASIISDLDRAIRDLISNAVAPLRSQIADLERQLRNQQSFAARINELDLQIRRLDTSATRTSIDYLERRINSIEVSARF